MDQADNLRIISTTELHQTTIEETDRRRTRPVPIASDNEWVISVLRDGRETRTAETQKPKIQLVPKMLRDLYPKCFDPMVVSIGPYHHGKPELQLAEKHKTTTARQFASGDAEPIDAFYNKVAAVTSQARGCYTANSTSRFSDEEFTHMMFLDGCFILHLIDCMMENKREGIKMKCHHIAFVLRDLFLLENQLPFVVLQALMSLKFPGGQGIVMVKNFIKRQIRAPKALLPDVEAGPEPHHLLQLMRTELLGKSPTDSTAQQDGGEPTFRSVKELKTAGIKFKKSNTSCFTDISFEPCIISGTLRLPPVAIDDSSKAKFLNLIAYEACPDTPDDYGITSYICFMDKLIDLPSDVKELRSEGIVQNFLGSDEEVAKLFNEISNELVPNPYTYAKVGKDIEKIYKNKCTNWITEMLHKHFSTPWTIMALLAGIYILIITTLQTHFTIFPLKKS